MIHIFIWSYQRYLNYTYSTLYRPKKNDIYIYTLWKSSSNPCSWCIYSRYLCTVTCSELASENAMTRFCLISTLFFIILNHFNVEKSGKSLKKCKRTIFSMYMHKTLVLYQFAPVLRQQYPGKKKKKTNYKREKTP